MVSRLGSVKAPIVNRPSKSKSQPYFLPWRQLPILSDGSVALCCDDWNGQGSLGNIADLEEMRHNHQRQNIRRLHMAGRAGEIDLCRVCRDPRPSPAWF
jgi:hypothetical protein